MPPAPTLQLDGYAALKKQVETTLLEGQLQIERARVQTYWQTGKVINDHILRHGARSQRYGEQVIAKLSEDLNISTSLLWRCVKFAQMFKKIVAGGPQSFTKGLSWSHFRSLITVADEETRFDLLRRASKSGWSAEHLAEKIRLEVRSSSGQWAAPQEPSGAASGSRDGSTPELWPLPPKTKPHLIPRRGKLYTYRLIAPDSAHRLEEEGQELWIDLGFQVHRELPSAARGLRPEQIIESVKKDEDYRVVASRGKEGDLFTYQGFVERVVDGDTLLVKIDLGFATRVRQYLRLRGIDAPELAAPEGKQARDFVAARLAQVPSIILTSSRSDKWDRYLADVYYGEEGRETYLNQQLLDQGLAQRWEG